MRTLIFRKTTLPDGTTKLERVLSPEEIEEKKKAEEKKIEEKGKLDKKTKNEYWLNEWRKIKIAQMRERQEKFIEWLKEKVPKERWNERKIRRFISKIDVRGIDNCWEWIAYVYKEGYGRFNCDGISELVHRFMYILIHGKISDDKPLVTHICNNRKCVNPRHLEAGTHDDNGKYMVKCGRQAKGNSNAKSKWTDEEVSEVRSKYMSGIYSYGDLVIMFGMSESNLYYILKNITRKDAGYQKWLDENNKTHRTRNI